MYSLLRDDPEQELLRDRLGRLLGDIRELKLATREEYQAEVFSRVNGILNLGNHMRPLLPITAEGPAVVGDVSTNLGQLNQDAIDIASQIGRIEVSTGQLYNLAAASQNNLRQQIREAMYASNAKRFVEAFVHERQLGAKTATVDFNAGIASLPVIGETRLTPAVSVGANSLGAAVTSTQLLLDGQIETAFVFEGTVLELVLTFPKPEIVNTLAIDLDDYQGLEITAFTTSPDGSVSEDVLKDLGADTLLLNTTASKYSGDVLLHFPPRHAQQIRLVIEDRVDQARIALRGLSVGRRQYLAGATLVTKPITLVGTRVQFSTTALDFAPFATVVHQISTDGVHFTNVTPGLFDLISPFWYKATLQRSAAAFDQESAALVAPGDLKQTPYYTLKRLSTVPLGAGVMERTIVLEAVTGPVQFRDIPLPTTFRVQEGAVYLNENEDYTFSGGTLSFPESKSLVIVTYQTSALGAAALATRQDYYTPLLSEVRFEVV